MRICLALLALGLTSCSSFDQRFLTTGSSPLALKVAQYRKVQLVGDSLSQADSGLLAALNAEIKRTGTFEVVSGTYVATPEEWLLKVLCMGTVEKHEMPLERIQTRIDPKTRQTVTLLQRQGSVQLDASFSLSDPSDPGAFPPAPVIYSARKEGSSIGAVGKEPLPINYDALIAQAEEEVCKDFVGGLFPAYLTVSYKLPQSSDLPELLNGMQHLLGTGAGGVKDPVKAEEVLRKALASATAKNVKPREEAKVHFALGLALLNQGKEKEALEEFTKAQNQAPRGGSVWDMIKEAFNPAPANYADAYQRVDAALRARSMQADLSTQAVSGGSPSPAAQSNQLTINDEPSYIRDTPSKNGERIMTLHPGDTVEQIEAQGEWIKVRCADGTVGWTLESNFH